MYMYDPSCVSPFLGSSPLRDGVDTVDTDTVGAADGVSTGFPLSTMGVDVCVDASTQTSTVGGSASFGVSITFSSSVTPLSTVSTVSADPRNTDHHSSTSTGFGKPLSRSLLCHQEGSAPSTSSRPPLSPSRRRPSDVIRN